MTRIRKKAIEVDAIPVSDIVKVTVKGWDDLPEWIRKAYDANRIYIRTDGVDIYTLEGKMRAELTDWIVRGVQGELYSIKYDILQETYDFVS